MKMLVRMGSIHITSRHTRGQLVAIVVVVAGSSSMDDGPGCDCQRERVDKSPKTLPHATFADVYCYRKHVIGNTH